MPTFAITGNEATIRNFKRPINNAEFFNLSERKVTWLLIRKLDVAAIITIISGSSQYYKEVTLAAEETPEVVQCFSTTGNGSHTLLVNTKNSYTLEELLRKIQSWPGVVRTETQIILSSYKDGIKIPIK